MLIALFALFALSASSQAWADDLSIVLDITGRAPVALTFNNVQPGVLPGISLPAVNPKTRASMRVEIDVHPVPPPEPCTEDCDPQVRLATRFIESRRGRDRVVSAPVVTAIVGQQAMVSQGARVPVTNADGTSGFETHGTSLTLLYTSTGSM